MPGGDTQVRYLNYADAEKIATKLREQIQGIVAAAAPGAGGAGGAAGTAAPQVTSSGGGDKSVMIWAEPQTNALVVTAPPKVMRSVMQIVDRLDIRRAQVLVEAISVALLSGLVVVQTVAGPGGQLVVDARVVAVGVAVGLLLLRANFLVVVLAAGTVAAIMRAVGVGLQGAGRRIDRRAVALDDDVDDPRVRRQRGAHDVGPRVLQAPLEEPWREQVRRDSDGAAPREASRFGRHRPPWAPGRRHIPG